jgi:acyl-CoA thioesterase-2
MAESPSEQTPESVNELLDLLDLEFVDTNLYMGHNPKGSSSRPSLFGGQVAAQALRAATLTVPEGRLPHSLHGYFLRPGLTDRPTILKVFVDRDGGSISARRVAAVQNGEEIFTLSASFQTPAEGPEMQVPMEAGLPMPDDLEATSNGMFEMRYISRHDSGSATPIHDLFWARTPMPLPEDPVLHACVLTYLSDLGSGMAELVTREVPGYRSPSLDHVVWFHRPLRLDRWVLFDMRPISASSQRGLYTGSFYDQAGRLGATIMQECLFRPERSR